MARTPWAARRRPDGDIDVLLGPDLRTALRRLLTELDEIIESRPDADALERLRPPAYLDDPERDAEFQLLAGEELRTSRRAAIATVLDTVDADRITEDQAWAWLQGLNALRLVIGTRLDLDDDSEPPDPEGADTSELRLWDAYELLTHLQHEVVMALR